MSRTTKLWLRLGEASVRTGAYAFVSAAGVACILITPKTIQAVLGPMMVVIWGLFMLVGGLAGALGAMFERWLIEYPAIPMVLTGLGLYLVALWSITGSGEWGRLAQTLLLTGYAMHLMARWVNLHALALALRSSS